MSLKPGPEDSIESIILEHHSDAENDSDRNNLTGEADFEETAGDEDDFYDSDDSDLGFGPNHSQSGRRNGSHLRRSQRQTFPKSSQSLSRNRDLDFDADPSGNSLEGEADSLEGDSEAHLFPADERSTYLPMDYDDGGLGLVIVSSKQPQHQQSQHQYQGPSGPETKPPASLATAAITAITATKPRVAVASLDPEGNLVILAASEYHMGADVPSPPATAGSSKRTSLSGPSTVRPIRSPKLESGVDPGMKPAQREKAPQQDIADSTRDLVSEIFGDDVSINLSSKQSQDRIQTLSDITTSISAMTNPKPLVFDCICQIIQTCLSDSVPKVVFGAIKLSELAMSHVAPKIPYAGVAKGALVMVPLLLTKSADSNAKVRDMAIACLETFARYPQTFEAMGPLLCNIESGSSWRHIVSRLTIMATIIPACGFHEQMSFESIMTFTSTALQNANSNVRKAAIAVTLQVYKLAGPKTEEYLRNLNPALLKLLNNELQLETGNPEVLPISRLEQNPPRKAEVTPQELEQLSEADLQTATPMFAIFGERFVLNCFSKTWSTRESAYNNMESILTQARGETRDVFCASCILILHGLQDSVPQVYLSAIKSLDASISQFSSMATANSVIQSSMDGLLPILVAKLGDSNTRVRDSTLEGILSLSKKPVVGHHIITRYLLQPVESMNAWRAVVGRLAILDKFVDDFGFRDTEKGDFQLEPVMSFVINTFQSPNGKVRKSAFDITLHIYESAGRSIETYLKKLKPALMKELRTAIIQVARKHRNIHSAPHRPLASLVAHLGPEDEFEFSERPATFNVFEGDADSNELQAKPWKAQEASKPAALVNMGSKPVIRNRLVFS